MSSDFKEFYDKHGIKREYSIPGTPQQNGVVERQNRIVQQMARSMMNENIIQIFRYLKETLNYGLWYPKN
jgi:transposase InsO family protein